MGRDIVEPVGGIFGAEIDRPPGKAWVDGESMG